MPNDGTVRRQKYEIGVHHLPRPSPYAAAYALTVEGRRVMATGDRQTPRAPG
ncbi:hypothetical protein ACIBBB_07440 [Streptomyces sp. NPDC051217]|uniref:hypothetical protein n=1 Tax=Streptomyces sp. NPDC051217 TaxID=3365644 RepID=UPI0037AD764F